jgi:multiple sugar transport system permease protein
MITVTSAKSNQGKRQKQASIFSLHGVLIGLALLYIIPIAWLVLGSLKVDTELRAYPIQIFPAAFRWENYLEAVTAIPYLTYVSNLCA